MNIIIASDSYKGSLTTQEVSFHIQKGVKKVFPQASFMTIPMADGGEGTVSAMVSSLGGEMKRVAVTGPMGKPVEAHFGIINGNEGVLEMASASGLPLVEEQEKNIMKATTYGTGQLLKAAMDLGCRKIFIGIGGSATNDGGIGMTQALGGRFLNGDGEEVPYGGGSLSQIQTIDLSQLDERLKETEIIVMCDVDNPLCGEKGAAAVYGPQKGADEAMIPLLDSGLSHLASLTKALVGQDFSQIPGAGAAGGLGFALTAFLSAKLVPGIQAVLEAAGFEEKLAWANLVITGEGRIDEQSVYGKVPTGVADIAKKNGVPVIAIVGSVGKNARAVYEFGIGSIESAVAAPMELQTALLNAGTYVEDAAERIMGAIKVGMGLR